jgi:hypothetical protein
MGRVAIVDTAHFFDDVPALPAHMVANNYCRWRLVETH